MIEIIEDLPDGVIGLASRGRITHEDYRDVVIPAIEKELQDHDKISLLYMMEDFEGMEMVAMWDDMSFGLKTLARF